MPRYVIAPVSEIPPGQRKIVSIAGRAVGIFNIGGEFYALRNRCPHQGGPLCEGRVSGAVRSSVPGEYDYSDTRKMLRCPWHGWEFDLRTGQSWFDPNRVRVRAYDVSVEPGAAIVQTEAPSATYEKGPYIAETYPVSIEEQHIVVEIDG